MDFELPISEPRVPKLDLQSSRRPNPFKIRPEQLEFDASARELERKRQERVDYLQMPLIERQSLLTPMVSFREIRERTPRTSRPMTTSTRPQTTRDFGKTPRQRRQRVAERVAETREIYMISLILNKKKKQQRLINETIETEQENLEKLDNDIYEESHRCTQETDRIEMEMQKARKAAEVATAERVELEKQIRMKESKIGLTEYDIHKNEDLLEQYNEYYKFLSSVCPEDRSFEDFSKDPNELIQLFQSIEDENKFVMKHCDTIEDIETRSNIKLSAQMQEAQERLDEISNRLNSVEVPEVIEPQDEENNQTKKDIDNELAYLSNIVLDLFTDCFHVKAMLTPVEMLERVEKALEEFYIESERLNQHFLIEKQSEIDDARSEALRNQVKAERERMLLEKKEQALARATKPVKKRMGRKLMERHMPTRARKKTDEELLLKLKEKERLEKLLYGEDDF